MKTYKNMFDDILNPQVVARCALDAAVGKLRRKEVIKAFADFDKTYDIVVKCANDPSYQPCEDNTHEIIDGANRKPRAIEKPKFCPEQILHHMIIEPFKPVLLNGLYEHVYGCLPPSVIDRNGKQVVKKYGPHAAIKRLRKWTQEKHRKLYVCETDVHHAYGSVDVDILLKLMERAIKDDNWLRLTKQFLYHAKEQGLILGHYTSPWFFNFYLKAFDHFAAQQGVRYLRFADNIFMVSSNKRTLRKALNNIRTYLREQLKLELNGSTQIYRFEYVDRYGKTRGRAINALGAVIHHNRITLRKSILMRMRRKSLRLAKKERTTWHDCASMLARLSWIRHTDTYTYYSKHIKPNINIRQLKAKVRAHSKEIMPLSKERRRIIYDGLEKSTRFANHKAGSVRRDFKHDNGLPTQKH